MSSGILPGASDVKILDSNFIDNSQIINPQTINGANSTVNSTIRITNRSVTSGLERLLGHSIPEALHDSSARDPPPRCHPGTRYKYIDKITNWGLNSDGRKCRMMWMYGPAGVGKSAVSQSCAEAIAERGKLGAAFFFSRPNKRINPNFFFTTISYQLAMKNKSCRKIIDTMIHDDPTLVTKSIKQQFQDLIVTPLEVLRARGEDMEELVIIVDGLDECASNRAQCEIVELVAASIRDRTTPFLWVFVSRPEAHIHATFTSPHLLATSLNIELPVSRDVDNEITKFLTDELNEVQREHHLPAPWPSERQIGTLVNLAAGLFIYASTVIRFINYDDSSGPDDQLQAVLGLADCLAKETGIHPLSELDFFYSLIMQRLPPKTCLIFQKIMLVTVSLETDIYISANVLGLSEAQLRNACRCLSSVLYLSENYPQTINFYHASFLDFLQDPKRSRSYCIKTDSAVLLRRELLNKLNTVHAKSNSVTTMDSLVTWPIGVWMGGNEIYWQILLVFFWLCQSIPLDHEMLTALNEFNYAKIPVLRPNAYLSPRELEVDKLLDNEHIPDDLRGKIIRHYPRSIFHTALLKRPKNAKQDLPYILGHGKNKALLWPSEYLGSYICPYPSESYIVSMARRLKGKVMGYCTDEVQ